MNLILDVNAHQKMFERESLTATEIQQRIKANKPAPSSVLGDKWTKEVVKCPACAQESFDKFTGGANVKDHQITHTEHFYHCRVCGLNLTEEEYGIAA